MVEAAYTNNSHTNSFFSSLSCINGKNTHYNTARVHIFTMLHELLNTTTAQYFLRHTWHRAKYRTNCCVVTSGRFL